MSYRNRTARLKLESTGHHSLMEVPWLGIAENTNTNRDITDDERSYATRYTQAKRLLESKAGVKTEAFY